MVIDQKNKTFYPLFQFTSLRSRILVFFLGLLILIQVISLYIVDLANTQNARTLIGEALYTTAQSFNHQLSTRNQALIQAGRLLSGDYAFKTAFATGKPKTIRTAANNQQLRIGADLMLILTLEGEYIFASDTKAFNVDSGNNQFPFPDFIEQTQNQGEASGIVKIQDDLYSIISVPLRTPIPSAWIILGFKIGKDFIDELQSESHVDISLTTRTGNKWATHVSTMNTPHTVILDEVLNEQDWPTGSVIEMDLDTKPYTSFINQLPSWGRDETFAILQRDRNEAMYPYYRLRLALTGLLGIALLGTVFGGGAIASSVTRPVRVLAGFARQIQLGNYSDKVEINQKDELGQLGNAFNEMSKGLYERDRVRNLLGKVISPEIAEELINKDVQLGGEEREMSIMFTDLRNFTSLSEKRQPGEVLDFLNEYLTRMTKVIDKHGGVVDKYVGDAIMALFGAPIELENHAESAVACALEMIEELEKSNTAFREKGWPELAMGIGINTDTVVVGNMGSRDRLNYTVIGDGVNLASRLESVTKQYETPIIVSESTRNRATRFNYRKLDRIQVKGKQQAVTIYTPI